MVRSILTGLASVAVLSQYSKAQFIITDDTYFYGQSEPVYPTREDPLHLHLLLLPFLPK